jgi:hypothetical protein
MSTALDERALDDARADDREQHHGPGPDRLGEADAGEDERRDDHRAPEQRLVDLSGVAQDAGNGKHAREIGLHGRTL